MRILHVTRELAGDRRFGIGRSLGPVLDALRAEGHQVDYLTQEHLGPQGRDWHVRWGQRLRPLARGLAGDAGALVLSVWLERLNMGRLAAKVAGQSHADVVHLHDPYMAWGFRLARRWHGATACRWGVTQHGFGSYTDAVREEGVSSSPRLLRWQRRAEAAVLARADWVLCPTAAAREQLARDLALPVAPGHWQVVPHARPTLAPGSRAEARARLGLRDGDWHVLAVGRLNPVKRLEAIVQACVALGRPLRLTLLGVDDASSLQALLPAGSPVRLEACTTDDVSPWLAAADVYVSAARNESFGLANLEALAAGLPVLCTAVGGVPEATGGAACLVPPGDRDLVRNLARVLDDWQRHPDGARRWALLGPPHVAAWPDAAEVASRLASVYGGDALPGDGSVVFDPAAGAVEQAAGLPPLCQLPQRMDLSQARRVLVFAPHPDDEAIGCGGLLALLARAGTAVKVVLVSDGSGAGDLPAGTDQVRQREFVASLAQLGVVDHALLGFPDGDLRLEPKLCDALARQVSEFAPDWVFVPSASDLHRDHRVVFEAVRRAAAAGDSVRCLWQYETWGPVSASHVLDITAVLDQKLAALSRHQTALAYGNYLEGTAGLARYRALLLGAPVPGGAAEAFQCTERSGDFLPPAEAASKGGSP